MSITDSAWRKQTAFCGYGNPNSPLWFLGIEEKLPLGVDLNKELRTRLTFKRIMDLDEAQTKLGREIKTSKTKTWMWMSKFARALLKGADDWRDKSKAREYRDQHLGRKGGQTFLMELFPFPARTCKDSPCPTRCRDRKEYENSILPKRRKLIVQMLVKHKPRYAIMYGKRKHYRQLFSESDAQESRKTDKYIFNCKVGRTNVVLISFFQTGFGHNTANQVIRLLRHGSGRRNKRLSFTEYESPFKSRTKAI